MLDFINRYEQSGEEAVSVIKKLKPFPVRKPEKWFKETKEDAENNRDDSG